MYAIPYMPLHVLFDDEGSRVRGFVVRGLWFVVQGSMVPFVPCSWSRDAVTVWIVLDCGHCIVNCIVDWSQPSLRFGETSHHCLARVMSGPSPGRGFDV